LTHAALSREAKEAVFTPALVEGIDKHKRFDAPIDGPLRRKVTVGFVVAVLLTIFIGGSSWRGARRAEQNDYWVSHTHEVMEAIQRTARHVIEAETSARAFALSGEEPLLANYQKTRASIFENENTLRQLTADNLSQQRRLDVLATQVNTGLAFADSIIAKRRSLQSYPGGPDAVETERLIEAVRVTTRAMYGEEERLLIQRTETAHDGQRVTRIIAIAGAFVGVGLWILAKLAVNREIGVSARVRSQLSTLNAELERRVEQRTAALESEIAERKRATAGRERLAAIVDSSDDAIISKDLNGIITAWNRGAERVFGYTSAEVIDKPLMILLPAERKGEEAAILARIQNGENVKHFETIRVRKDGTHIDVSVTISPIRDSRGVIVGASKITRDITDRKRSEAALRESEERLQAMANGIPQLAWMAEPDGNIVWYNQRWYDYTGTTLEQMKGWGWERVHDPEMLPKVMERWQAAIAAGTPFEMEFPLRAANGEFGAFLTRVVPVKDASGRVTRWFGTNTDISEIKRTEMRLATQAQELSVSREALEAQSRIFKLVLDSMGEGLVAADAQGQFLIWNDAAKQQMGRDAEGLPSERWAEFYKVFLPDGITPYPPERLPLVLALRGESVRVELMVEHPGRTGKVFLEVTARPMKDATGGLCGGVAVLRDISERKQAEASLAGQAEELSRQAAQLVRTGQALEEQSSMLRLVMENMAEGLVAADREGHFLIWNDAARRLMGQDAAELPSQQWTEHYQMFLADGVTPYPTESLPLMRALRGESSQQEMVVRHLAEPGVCLEVTARPMKDGKGGLCGGVVVFRDITQRKADERKILELNQNLEVRVSERTDELKIANEELESFTYSVSHDLRAPLRHVAGFCQILVEDCGAEMSAEARHHLERIEYGVSRMGLLVDELLDLARVGRHPLKLQPANLKQVIEEVVSILQPEILDRDVTWKIADLPMVECDPILIKQVFQNLIANALKFTRTRECAVIEIDSRNSNGQVEIRICDNGVGFDMKYADKLFGVFQRLHRAEDFEGTGIGLAIVQRIVHKHHGRVWAESEVGKGATFFFTLEAAKTDGMEHGEQGLLTSAGVQL
jgi:PAS domain S-box-containing protein